MKEDGLESGSEPRPMDSLRRRLSDMYGLYVPDRCIPVVVRAQEVGRIGPPPLLPDEIHPGVDPILACLYRRRVTG